MPACVIKFRSVIQGGTLWPEHDVVFLLQAGLARPGGRVEPPPPGNDFPVEASAEASGAALAWRSEVMTVAIVSCLEGSYCDPGIKFCLSIVSPYHFCFIDNTWC